jgi:hypothetical protein
VRWSLCEQACHPNETNLDTHYALPEMGIWNTYIQSLRHDIEEDIIPPRASLQEASSMIVEPPGPRKLVSNVPASPSTYSTLSSTPKLPSAPSPSVLPLTVSALIPKLRWANIGWFYHWGTKQYDFSKGKQAVDRGIRDICKKAVDSVLWAEVFDDVDLHWGIDEPGWETWSNSYGASIMYAHKLHGNKMVSRTGRGNCQLLPAEGHANGAC